MYSKLLFYLEACESGSMFHGILPKDIGVCGGRGRGGARDARGGRGRGRGGGGDGRGAAGAGVDGGGGWVVVSVHISIFKAQIYATTAANPVTSSFVSHD